MSDDLRKIAEALYRVWDVEIDPQSRPSWDELRPKVRDSWCVLADAAVAAVGGVPLPMRLTCPGKYHVGVLPEYETLKHFTQALFDEYRSRFILTEPWRLRAKALGLDCGDPPKRSEACGTTVVPRHTTMFKCARKRGHMGECRP